MDADRADWLSDPVSLCHADLLEARENFFARLDQVFTGVVSEQPLLLCGINGASSIDPYTDPEGWVYAALDNLSATAGQMLQRCTSGDLTAFRPLVLEFGPYGVHFIDRIYGARVTLYEDQWWSEYLQTPVGELTRPDLDRDPTWELARRAAAAFVESGVTVPLFGLPTLSSALNVLLNLYGESALLTMHTDPDAVRHDLFVINDLLCELHAWYRDHIPAPQLQPVVAAQRCQPRRHSQLCGCSTHLISAAMYRDFIADLDDALLSVYGSGGMIHLCGAHKQHIPTWREMASVRAVQVNDRAAEDLPLYFPELRQDQIIYLNPTDTMTVSWALEITGGERLIIVADPNSLSSG